MILLAFQAVGFAKQKSGDFIGSCKFQGFLSDQAPVKVNLLKKGVTYNSSEDLTPVMLYPNNKTDANKLLVSQLLGKNMFEFKVHFDEYTDSVRFNGIETNSLTFKLKSKVLIPSGATQTIWGGGNTAYMTAQPECKNESDTSALCNNGGYAFIKSDNSASGETLLKWDITKENFKFKPGKGLQALTTAYEKSAVNKYFDVPNRPAEGYWTEGITPNSTKKYWPKTRRGEDGKPAKGGPKHGELIVTAFMLVNLMDIPRCVATDETKNQHQCTEEALKGITEALVGGKYETPTFTYDGAEYSLYSVDNGMIACVTNLFTTYDIYWNTWVAGLGGALMVFAAIVITPTKCINVRAKMQKKKEAQVAMTATAELPESAALSVPAPERQEAEKEASNAPDTARLSDSMEKPAEQVATTQF